MVWLTAGVLLAGLLASGTALSQPHASSPPGEQPAVLQGGVRETVYPVAFHADRERAAGMVLDAGNGQSLQGVVITVPSSGYRTVSDANGRFFLPGAQASRKAEIVFFSKPGYEPRTATLDLSNPALKSSSSAGLLRIGLRAEGAALVLDNQLRHLGDDSYSPISAGASRFRGSSQGPLLVREFTLPHVPAGSPRLEIGSVIGLDTLAAHRAGQSSFHRFSTPMRVKLNGRLIGHIAINGDGETLPVPPDAFRPGRNVLAIETGYETSDGVSIDYDDMELMLITLRW